MSPASLDWKNSGELIFEEPKSENWEIIFSGDFYPGYRTEELCKSGKLELLYNNALPLLIQKDLSVTNLECPLTRHKKPIPKIGPHLSAHPDCVNALKYGGFDVAALANNHILDQGPAGLLETIDACTSVGIKTVGAAIDFSAVNAPLIVNVKSLKVAIINFAENEFSIAKHGNAGANGLDPISNYFQIMQAKSKADVIFVVIHGGHEFYSLPSPRMVNTYRFFADLGVTAIIGHHPHCASGFEIYKGVPIFYSLGNFIFDGLGNHSDSWYTGYLLKISLSRNIISKISIYPYFQFKDHIGIQLMQANDKIAFLDRIATYSQIIQDEIQLVNNWETFCKSKETEYIKIIFQLNIIKKACLKLGIEPKVLIKESNMLWLLNLLRCEAHRDLSIAIIEKILLSEIESRTS